MPVVNAPAQIMKTLFSVTVMAAALVHPGTRSQEAPRVEKRTAAAHPMQYFASPPDHWNADREWPVLVVITDAYRAFEETTKVFARARGTAPFVIVTPLVLSGGGTAQQHMNDFDYDQAAWDRAAKDGNCAFDTAGLTAVLADVRQRYHTDSKAFITGWEAGGHVVLSQVLNEPERFRGAVVVTPNFQSRCVIEPPTRHDAAAMTLPVRNLVGSNDTMAARGPITGQWGVFENLARSRGFTDLKTTPLAGRGHGSLAPDVFDVLATWIHS